MCGNTFLCIEGCVPVRTRRYNGGAALWHTWRHTDSGRLRNYLEANAAAFMHRGKPVDPAAVRCMHVCECVYVCDYVCECVCMCVCVQSVVDPAAVRAATPLCV